MIKKAVHVGNHGYSVNYPDQCPICHRYSEIKTIKTDEANKKTEVQVVFQCAFTECGSFFVGYYGAKPHGTTLKFLKPSKTNLTPLPKSVVTLSPQFISIYEEAEEAKHLGLTQIAGPGYRKAFEFLIKDYAKKLAPADADKIEKSFSGEVVSKYITDTRIKEVSTRTLWLGNDETHYLRKWQEHDINDLIVLIRLAVNWIDIDELSNNYKKSMPSA